MSRLCSNRIKSLLIGSMTSIHVWTHHFCHFVSNVTACQLNMHWSSVWQYDWFVKCLGVSVWQCHLLYLLYTCRSTVWQCYCMSTQHALVLLCGNMTGSCNALMFLCGNITWFTICILVTLLCGDVIACQVDMHWTFSVAMCLAREMHWCFCVATLLALLLT